MKSDKEIFQSIIRQEALKKTRTLFDPLLGSPFWWITPKPNGPSSKTKSHFLHYSSLIWSDPRSRKFSLSGKIYTHLKKRAKELRPFFFRTGFSQPHFCIPLIFSGKVTGYLGLSFDGNEPNQEALNLLAAHIQLIKENSFKSDELERLSATLRPRAVALSTVHTVHRIINSTLDLNELISRIAHLTAQVLRAERCAIYLLEKDPSREASKPGLVCKALVGYPKKSGTIGKTKISEYAFVAKASTAAQNVLRKKFICTPLIDEDVVGVVLASRKKDKSPFNHFDQEILSTLAEEAVIAIKNARTYEDQKKVTLGTIQSLAEIMGTRTNSPPPQEFLKLALKIAEELRLRDDEIQALHYATLLKDTARVGIPDEILKKPTKLTGEEYKTLKEHPFKGAKIVQSFENLKPVVPVILHLREKFDGTGYPKGLKGEEIPIGSRILSVISAFEAIVMGRPYRTRASWNEAVEEILRNTGTQFDPKVVEVFARRAKKEDFHKFLA